MAKSQYSADSASPPQFPSPSHDNKVGTFKIAYFPAPYLKDTLSMPTPFVLAGISYVGENVDLRRRIPEHNSIRRKAGHSGTYTTTPSSID
ncbi:hypothetical protein [Bradyrhizobium arachidis]|uniref:Uncharacterized protein n=1 Tax=Bradyrhizobium arachidis TaxID=858423 RepID=A0AAE7NN76_9BRAD|nr:hypothetical protein [Bradyrhizobium arachidis]QOZ67295.1 hypothetical protein WN72_13970 [Bradyrhizobium arachidis]SFU79512.1 hypothetical protein SAMN05192541_1057 [Bradyrhizobium arachidis]